MLSQGTIFSFDFSVFVIVHVDSVIVGTNYQCIVSKFNVRYPLLGMPEYVFEIHCEGC